jgi:hypothetical protein
MKRAVRTIGITVVLSVALAAVAKAAEPLALFNGKDFTGWKVSGDPAANHWVVGTARLDEKNPAKFVIAREGTELINSQGGGGNIFTEQEFGDCVLTLEVMVPKGSNSGIYPTGVYEVQVLDSFGRQGEPRQGDMGGIYHTAAPRNPTYKAPGEWQTFEIHFQAPRFDASGKKTVNAKFIKVVLNGVTIHENVEALGPTGGGIRGNEAAKGPLMFQGDHGPVAFRNIRITPKK